MKKEYVRKKLQISKETLKALTLNEDLRKIAGDGSYTAPGFFPGCPVIVRV